MRLILAVMVCLLIPERATCQEEPAAKSDLHVIYLSREDDESRLKSFDEFLQKHFVKVSSMKRSEFDSTEPCDADVVIVDWSQQEDRDDDYPSPLGELEDWSTPTVLLGSAGQIIAGPWRIPGGAG